MLNHVPEALRPRIVVPAHGSVGPQTVEHFVVLEALEAVEIEKVNSFESHGSP
jgi:hypothetical protein